MLVAMVYELREHDPHGGLIVARSDHAIRIIARRYRDRMGACQRGDRDEILERASLRLAHRRPEHPAGQQPDVELLATPDGLERQTQRPVRAGAPETKCRGLNSA